MATISGAAGLLFLNFYLQQTSRQIADDFRHQYAAELASGDSYLVARALGSLSTSVHWVCISASRNNEVFYQRSASADCSSRPWQTQIVIPGQSTDSVALQFTLTLPPLVRWGSLGFLFLQLGLIWASFFAARKSAVRIENQRREGQAELNRLATQVAHDIRSPLGALKVATFDLQGMSIEKHLILQSAIQRIHDIADQLLASNRVAERQPSTDPSNVRGITSLAALVREIVTEKKLQFKSRTGIQFRLESGDSHHLQIDAGETELKTVISNLINNSIEAIDGEGTITLTIEPHGSWVRLKITDTGKGIPADRMQNLGLRGNTFGKADGSGLGLFHARTHIESWGGKLTIESVLGKSTEVSLDLRAKVVSLP